jgi:geranylgeranyl diphosphate synthase type II
VLVIPKANPDADISGIRRQVVERLDYLLPSGAALQTIMRDMALGGGKLLRPVFMMIVGRQFECDSRVLLDAGCAIEMVHAASLVLDDLPSMDNSPERRGLPAAHIRFGINATILAALALLGRAFSVISSEPLFQPHTHGPLTAILAKAVGVDGLVGGQFQELRLNASSVSPEQIQFVNVRKTAALFFAVVEMAACIAGVDG